MDRRDRKLVRCGPPSTGSGFSGGKKRLAPEVDAPYGTPLKMYTPFRSNPRIFPALVSTTVLASEQTTLLRPQRAVVGCARRGGRKPSQKVGRCNGQAGYRRPGSSKTPPCRPQARLPFEKGVKRSSDALECDRFSKSFTVLLLFRKMQGVRLATLQGIIQSIHIRQSGR